ncbi:hypothetical protein J1605_017982 [Eschrichtius robustus]|uniref:Uncharacterized protein n=1 Tax=Eschrichtius robustus TaxID=9764 RepID=A0AB34HY81_ESCRO|nr:hypothetical protein J1605_017982 [Eschrichtius robustus]
MALPGLSEDEKGGGVVPKVTGRKKVELGIQGQQIPGLKQYNMYICPLAMYSEPRPLARCCQGLEGNWHGCELVLERGDPQKLYNSSGRDLRRALFSLKQIFQDDKDLVHEFVVAEGLTCLIKVGAEADQNYQNYILRGK